jgi:hypothetical protein
MISYELAKELKEKGFSKQVYNLGDLFYTEDIQTGQEFLMSVNQNILDTQFDWLKTRIFSPNLKQLIEHCFEEDKYFQLSYMVGSKKWEAYFDLFFNSTKVDKGRGSNPEEAVANLWLNKQKRNQ